ncbi:MAG TPA: DinB family protein [Candidatus Angelobacter sp.]
MTAWVSTAFAQSASAPKTVTQQFDRSVAGPERACLALANAMPADRYDFVPRNGEFTGVRSFAQLAKHIAVDNYLNGAALLGEKSPVDSGAHENGPDSIQTKAQVLTFLQDSFTYLHKAVATVNDRNLMELVDYPGGGRVSRLAVVASAISHPWDIYGQMIEYMRMNGIDPQAAH